jgi:hypothetical protein
MRDRFDAGHEFLVFALRIVDQAHRRLGDRSQLRDLARMIHAQLDDCGLVRGFQPDQRQRHADVVIQVAAGRQVLLGTELGGQDGRDHFLDRGLAIAAGDAYDRDVELAPPVRADLAERRAGIGHHQRRQREAGRQLFYHHGSDAARGDIVQEVMRIETLAAQGDEELAGTGFAAVGGQAMECGGGGGLCGLKAGLQLRQGRLDHSMPFIVTRAASDSAA